MHIGVVYYYVSDMDRALAFYRDQLGLKLRKLEPAGEAWAELETGGTILALEEKPKRGASHRPPLGGAVVSFCVEDIEKVKADLEDRGVHFIIDILIIEEHRVKVAQFEDPDGNLLELHERF